MNYLISKHIFLRKKFQSKRQGSSVFSIFTYFCANINILLKR